MSDLVIHLEEIKKNYIMGRQELQVLKGISLDIQRNEYVALMGPSGSGKSTLMNILGCLDSPSSGKYILNGHDVSTMLDNNLADIRNKEIGFVFQQFNLLARTSALDNVAVPLIYAGLGYSERRERAQAKLEAMGLGNRLQNTPAKLSGGQQQRVAIARALVTNPLMLLADEPTGALDTQTSLDIMGIFQKLNDEGITLIVVTHEPDIAEYAARRIVFRDGQVIEDAAVKSRRRAVAG
jgi:putative ABC transport system ATP-binding protein